MSSWETVLLNPNLRSMYGQLGDRCWISRTYPFMIELQISVSA